MPRVNIGQLSTSALKSEQDLFTQLRTLLNDADRQLQQQTLVTSRTDNKNEVGMKRGDVIVRLVNDKVQVGVWTGKKNRYLNHSDLGVLESKGTRFMGYIEGTDGGGSAATRDKHFPKHGDWGIYRNTALPGTYFVFNRNASLDIVQLT